MVWMQGKGLDAIKMDAEWLNAILKWNIKVRLNILCFLTMYGALFAA